jgi:undecaprenyl-diphosphatase
MGDIGTLLYSLDRAIFLVVNRTLQNPVFDLLMPVLSDKRAGLLLAAVVIPWFFVRFGRRAWPVVLVAALAIGLSDLSANLIKQLLQRVRPCHVIPDVHLLVGCTRSFAMPSNHASNMFALAGVFIPTLPGWRLAVVILAGAVAYSRMYLGVHYPADVLVGAVWGVGFGYGLVLLGRQVLPADWMPLAEPTSKTSA